MKETNTRPHLDTALRSKLCLLVIYVRRIHHRLGVPHLSPLRHLPVLEALAQNKGDRRCPGGV